MNPLDLVRSLVDFKFYREVPGRTFANASAFLGMLSTVFALCLVVAMSIQIVPKLRSSLAWARDSFPEITLSEGTISSPVKGELVVRHPDAKQIVIAFDADRETPVGPKNFAKSARSPISRATRSTSRKSAPSSRPGPRNPSPGSRSTA